MLNITSKISIPLREIQITYISSQGAGGQNVNKLATAAHLRFDIVESSLPEEIKQRLFDLADSRITDEGIVVIKAQSHRTREQNRQSALHRLQKIVRSVVAPPKKRKPTKPTAASRQRRLEAKSKRSTTKSLRGKIRE